MSFEAKTNAKLSDKPHSTSKDGSVSRNRQELMACMPMHPRSSAETIAPPKKHRDDIVARVTKKKISDISGALPQLKW